MYLSIFIYICAYIHIYILYNGYLYVNIFIFSLYPNLPSTQKTPKRHRGTKLRQETQTSAQIFEAAGQRFLKWLARHTTGDWSTVNLRFLCIRLFPKIGGNTPNHPFVHSVFPCKPSILGVLPPIFGNTQKDAGKTPQKTKEYPLKMDGWKMHFLLK